MKKLMEKLKEEPEPEPEPDFSEYDIPEKVLEYLKGEHGSEFQSIYVDMLRSYILDLYNDGNSDMDRKDS